MAETPKFLDIKTFMNPAGQASHARLIINAFVDRYKQFIVKTINMKAYKDGKSYVFLFKIPSEKNHLYLTDMFYDIIVEFYPRPNTTNEDDKTVIDYGLRVFSNCPTFVFQYTHLYYKMGALYRKIDTNHYSHTALEEPAKIANPYKLVGIEKSIFYALNYIFEKTNYNKGKIDGLLIKLPKIETGFQFPGNLFSDVKTQDSKMNEIAKHNKSRLNEKKRKKRKAGHSQVELRLGNTVLASDEVGGRKSKRNLLESDLVRREDNFKSNLTHSFKKESVKNSLTTSKLKTSGLTTSRIKSKLKKK